MKKEEIEQAAREYSTGKSSSDVFREAHETDFIAGANWALQSENERLKAEMSIDEAMLKDVDIKIIEFALDGKKWSLHSSGEYYYYDKYGSWPPSETMELSDVKNIYESEREWISVETKKPNSDRIVLVFAPDCKIIGSILIGRYYEPERGFNESWTVYDFDQSKLDQIVTHWKELPKPPKQSCPQCKTEYTKEELLTNEHCFKCGFEMKGF